MRRGRLNQITFLVTRKQTIWGKCSFWDHSPPFPKVLRFNSQVNIFQKLEGGFRLTHPNPLYGRHSPCMFQRCAPPPQTRVRRSSVLRALLLLPICQDGILSFSLQAWEALRICFLFLKGRSNTLTGFPYRITSLLCSVFREISSQVQWHCVYSSFSWNFQNNSFLCFYRGHGCAAWWIYSTGVSKCTASVSEVTNTTHFNALRRSYHSIDTP